MEETDDGRTFYLPNREKDLPRLKLFWEAAQPLKRVLAELPDIGTGFKMKLTPVLPREALSRATTLPELVNSSVSSELEIEFQNLPEPLFERLALRFRPFYANDEDVNFLRMLNTLAEKNRTLLAWKKELKAKWERAVFWGAMGMPGMSPSVKAEEVIKTGLYSRYVHLNAEHRAKAAIYEEALGAEMFRIALVSSVWQRSLYVSSLADLLENLLVGVGELDANQVAQSKEAPVEKDKVVLKLQGGVGAVQFQEIPRADEQTSSLASSSS